MKFHGKTFELIGHPDLPLDPARGASAALEAVALDIDLPAAVAEWYCVPELSQLWRWYSGEHSAAAWQKAKKTAVIRYDPTDEESYYDPGLNYHDWWISHHECWLNPPVCRDLSGWVKGPILPLMVENQGCWEWGVVLDGSADPSAVISFGGGTWDNCAESFSTYVYARIFDAAPLGPATVSRHLRVEECVGEQHRLALREMFRIEPTTRGAGCVSGVFTERFSRPGCRFSFCNLYEHRFSLWTLSAADTDGFLDLVSRLGSIVPALSGVAPE
jgi:hypothetical protein